MKSFIGIGKYRLDLPQCNSLKDKRQAVRGLLDKLGRSRVTGACEAGENEYWKSSVIVVTVVSSSFQKAGELLTGARSTIDSSGIEVIAESEWVLTPEDIEETLSCRGE